MGKSIVRYMAMPAVQENLKKTLSENSREFTVSVAALVNSNQALQECTQKSVLSACLVATGLGLPINNSLGLAHIIPYNTKVTEVIDGKKVTRYEKQAQFQMAAKGFKQLAIRTGKYLCINDTDVREGEYLGKNRLTGEDKFSWIEVDSEREKHPVSGYLAFFKLNTGYEKTLYMTVKQLKTHGLKYSKTYARGFGKWKDDFDVMAKKTVIKLLISRHGLLSSANDNERKLAKAIELDQSVVKDGVPDYVDGKKPIDANEVGDENERIRIVKFIEDAKTIGDLKKCKNAVRDQDEEVKSMYEAKEQLLNKVK